MSRTERLVFQFALFFAGSVAAEAQVPNPLGFNTAADGTYNAFAEGAYDANWAHPVQPVA